MACGDSFGADRDRLLMKEIKFYMRITKHARARRRAAQISLHERRNDLLVKIRLEIEREMRNAQFPCNAFRISEIVNGAAAAVSGVGVAEVVVHLHRQTDDVMSGGLENECGGR